MSDPSNCRWVCVVPLPNAPDLQAAVEQAMGILGPLPGLVVQSVPDFEEEMEERRARARDRRLRYADEDDE